MKKNLIGLILVNFAYAEHDSLRCLRSHLPEPISIEIIDHTLPEKDTGKKISGYDISDVIRLAQASDMAYKIKKKQVYQPSKLNITDIYKLTDDQLFSDNAGFIGKRENGEVIISFAGTTSLRNVLTDVWANWAFDHENGGCYHNGIFTAFKNLEKQIISILTTIADEQKISLKEIIAKTEITGHSLGGGIALVTADILRRRGMEAKGVATFAAPRVMDMITATAYDKEMYAKTLIIKQYLDPVPVISPLIMGSKQVGSQLLLPYHLQTWHHLLGGYVKALEAFKSSNNTISANQHTFFGWRNDSALWHFKHDSTKNQMIPNITKTFFSLGVRAMHRIALDTVEGTGIVMNTAYTHVPRLLASATLKTISFSASAISSSAEQLNAAYFDKTSQEEKSESIHQSPNKDSKDILKTTLDGLNPASKTIAKGIAKIGGWLREKISKRVEDFKNDIKILMN